MDVCLVSNMRSPDGGPRFRVQEGGKWIEDDDFIFDAVLRIDGDFGDSRLAYAQWIADALNAADEKLTAAHKAHAAKLTKRAKGDPR